jgi:2-iminobutanoate/2-iminopropanoate deaminase
MISYISTPKAPTPAGHYSQATLCNGVVYVSGQLPVDPTSGSKVFGSIEEQADQALRNLVAVLEEAGSDLDHVLKVTIYLADMALWDRVNAVYARFFGESRPARSVVPTKELHHGLLIEIDATAVVA